MPGAWERREAPALAPSYLWLRCFFWYAGGTSHPGGALWVLGEALAAPTPCFFLGPSMQ